MSTYAWDLFGAGFPFAAMHEEMTALGVPPLWPPSADAARLETMRTLWHGAGLVQIETHEIEVQRTYADFESFWDIARSGPRIVPKVAGLSRDQVDLLKERLRARLVPDAAGQHHLRRARERGAGPRAGTLAHAHGAPTTRPRGSPMRGCRLSFPGISILSASHPGASVPGAPTHSNGRSR